MTTLTIKSDDEQAIKKVKELAESLDMPVEEESTGTSSKRQKLANLLRKWHKQGGLITSIDDPVEWQREQRKDRKLPFREE
ncbi:MAG: hypothetical protein RIC35_13025 [Marinoscillum sp.]